MPGQQPATLTAIVRPPQGQSTQEPYLGSRMKKTKKGKLGRLGRWSVTGHIDCKYSPTVRPSVFWRRRRRASSLHTNSAYYDPLQRSSVRRPFVCRRGIPNDVAVETDEMRFSVVVRRHRHYFADELFFPGATTNCRRRRRTT